MRDFLLRCLALFDHVVIVYFVVLNSILLFLILLAARAVAQSGTKMTATEADEIFASPFTPGISMIVPAFNEQVLIVQSVRSMLDLKYPDLEVVVVDDGSTDGTFAALRDAFDLEPAEYVLAEDVPHIGEVLSTHRSRRGDPLVVIRKANTGRRSDAINVAINATRKPLIGITDADSVMDESALLHMIQPFLDDPERMVAVGGTIRVVNGTTVAGGRVQSPSQPRTWLARIQVLEYLRSFLLGRVAWSKMNGLLIVSGAFGLFRRDVVVAADGLDLDSLAEDAEFITRLHRDLRLAGIDYRIGFTAEPVCWTEAPSTASQLRRQRRRWSRGLAELLWTHRSMIGNPRYGRIGLIVLPYYLLFELLGAVFEVAGFVAVLAGLWLGAVDVKFMLLFMAVAWLYGLLVSAVTLAIEEFSFHRYERWGDLGISVLASVGETILYRPLHALWRLEGLVAAIRKTEASWDALQRTGFDDTQEDDSKATVS